MPPREVDPALWGLIGALLMAVVVLIGVVAGRPIEMASPIAGGFFTGWLFGLLWNWSGTRR